MQTEYLTYVTNHDKKFKEAQQLIPQLQQFRMPHQEKWSFDIKEVVNHKLSRAKRKLGDKPFIVEDTALYLDALNDFPGALVHWLSRQGYDELFALIQKTGVYGARATTMIGCHDGSKEYYFSGEISGKIVAPSGIDGFGWDSIFKPDGLDETFAEMGDEFKPEFSMRTKAFKLLADHLQN